jgi:ribosomal protein S18 acetylase RimI-like enzyme
MSAQAPSNAASPETLASAAAGAGVYVCPADYANPHHAQVLVALLDAYAQDPMGGAEPLSDFAKQNLIACLAARPQAFSVLAFEAADEKTPIGLVNCIEGFSTFACKPLVNVHDVVVLPTYRGQRVAERMFAVVETMAQERGACKLTLEVLSGNLSALRLYTRLGFAQYQLDPAAGSAQFLQKWLD